MRRPQPFRTIHAPIAAIVAASFAAVACGASGTTLTTPTSLSKCGVTAEASASTFPANGGTASITVSTERECQWSATADGAWLSITAGSTGQGPGTVQLAAATNTDPATRTAAIVINDQRVQVTQAAAECRFDLGAHSASFPQAGGTGSVDVHASSPLCGWSAASAVDWISITSGASGKGSSAVAFNVSPTSGPTRTGTLTIAGQTLTVTQSQGCTFSLSPASASAPAGGGAAKFDVHTADGCGWSATSSTGWLTVTAGSIGTGNGSVQYAVAANTGASRTGTITAGGQAFTVTQDASCSFSISPSSQNIGSSGATVSVGVTAPAGCAWSAASQASWIGITSGNSGSGNGTVQLVIAANTGADRSGTVTIAGQTFTVTQAGGCTYTLSPTSQQVASAGGTGSFSVNAGAACAWTAKSNVDWIAVTSAANGSGAGTVQFTVAANSGGARTGTIGVVGQTFTVNQNTGCTASLSPDTIAAPSSGTSANVQITTASDCSWIALSNVPWISLPGATAGTGNGQVPLAIAANTGPARTGTATIAARTVTVNQDSGCTVAISPSSQDVAQSGGTGSVAVTAAAGCTWTAVSGAPWITVTSGTSGAGAGTVQFTVDANTTGAPRTGTITVGGQVFTVNQSAT